MNARDDDLLQPTLAADLDVRRFKRLFRPQSILWPTFFGGPIAGGALFGLNYARMGRRDLALRTWAGAIVLGLVLAFAIAWYLTDPEMMSARKRGDGPSTSTTRLFVAGISVAIGWFLVKNQEPRFAAWEGASNQPANLWIPGVLAVLAGGAVMIGVAIAAVMLRTGTG